MVKSFNQLPVFNLGFKLNIIIVIFISLPINKLLLETKLLLLTVNWEIIGIFKTGGERREPQGEQTLRLVTEHT